jgi:hypothetical protein
MKNSDNTFGQPVSSLHRARRVGLHVVKRTIQPPEAIGRNPMNPLTHSLFIAALAALLLAQFIIKPVRRYQPSELTAQTGLAKIVDSIELTNSINSLKQSNPRHPD